MKVCCISDTHGLHRKMKHSIPECDILCCAGDISNIGEYEQVVNFLDWLNDQPARHKVFIAGNHDWLFQLGKKKREKAIKRHSSIHYLESSGVEIEGIKIWGDPHQPEFCNWAFNLHRGAELREKWNMIPPDTDILITHGPPMCILDEVAYTAENVGCLDLLDRVNEVKPLLHVFGHIHSEHGIKVKNDTVFVNASICNEAYSPVNKPIVVDIKKEK